MYRKAKIEKFKVLNRFKVLVASWSEKLSERKFKVKNYSNMKACKAFRVSILAMFILSDFDTFRILKMFPLSQKSITYKKEQYDLIFS
jgi:hypothetical protein